MARQITLKERCRASSERIDPRYDPLTENGEPELIARMKELGINPQVQQNYIRLMPHQGALNTGNARVSAVIGNIKDGIEYLSSRNQSTAKLERALDELKEKYPMHFASGNRGICAERKPTAYKALSGILGAIQDT